jgi:DNA mismatch repair protein MutL
LTGAVEAVGRKTEPAAAGRRVRILPENVANQIAAGEVVERPASVVKELVENSLDAGASRVLVELEQAGTALIAVVDDGEGLVPEDAVCAFARHATSKLTAVDDLERIGTLGFRGEALASIGAVSETTLVTRRQADLAATRLVVRHGVVGEATETGAPAGTRVEVAGLFANIPARRKFLKAPATEVGHVSELITRMALAWPQVSFTLRHGGRTLAEYAGVGDHRDRVRQVLRAERAEALMYFESRGAAGAVSGWLSKSHMTFPSARQIYTYVNRRYVRDKLVTHALLAGYSTLLMHGRYPAAVVFLDVPFDQVDVNVHPAKSEIRFRRSGAVHDLLVHAVQTRLRQQRDETPGTAPIAPAARIPMYGGPQQQPPTGWSGRLALRPGVPGPSGAPLARPGAPSYSAPARQPDAEDRGYFSSLMVLGQLFEGYLVGQGEEQLVLIDQHAAHERVMFERLRSAYRSGAVPRQQLLVPAVVEIGPREAALLREQIEALAGLGFEIEPYAGDSFAVRAVPALLADSDAAALLRDLAEDLVEVGRSRRLDEAAEAVLSRLACHSAVRVGQNMGPEQVASLLTSMDETDFSGNCPHGRPSFITFSRSDLERWFKRT